MCILIDADGCPVVRPAVEAANRHGVGCTIVCDAAHSFDLDGVRVITVDTGADSADFALVNLCRPGDVVITQDYGLAAMCLAKGAAVLNQNGMVYSDANIGALLDSRYIGKKARRAGQWLKGPKKRTARDDRAFAEALSRILEKGTDNAG